MRGELQLLSFQGGIAGIWFEVRRSGFHYTTVLLSAARVTRGPCWLLLVWLAAGPGNNVLGGDVQRGTGLLCCSTAWAGSGGLERGLLRSL